ncbi:MAG: MOSC N-terminal beta barrel domain-containing protein, partial [Acetobacteraceae bacterium]
MRGGEDGNDAVLSPHSRKGSERIGMADREGRRVGTVEMLRRYPVKSMLGEVREALTVARGGILGDRAWAVLDRSTGKVASAKRPKLWRGLLACAARTPAVCHRSNDAGGVEIELPDGTIRYAGDPELDDALSALTGRTVRLANAPPDEAEIDRAYPES